MSIPRTPKESFHEKPRLSLDRRFVRGRVTSVGSDYCNLDLPDDLTGRLHKSDADEALQARWKDLNPNQDLEVFLLKPGERRLDFWHVSQRWARRENNPWIKSPPRIKQEVCGTVIQYVADYAAIIKLDDSGIDAFLHVLQVPKEGYANIADILFVGDRVCAEVMRVDVNRLEVHLDLLPLIRRKREEARALNHQLQFGKQEKDVGPAPETVAPKRVLAGITLWLIDNDYRFLTAIKEWLKPLGAEVVMLEGRQDLQAHIGKAPDPTHLVVDYDLGEPKAFEACLHLARTLLPQVRLAACSSNDQELRTLDIPSLVKPVDSALLLDWLTGHQLPPLHQIHEARQELWMDQALDMDFHSEAIGLLKELCEEHDEEHDWKAALWVERTRPGVYEAIAWHGLDDADVRQVQPFFSQTLVGNVIEKGEDGNQENLLGRLADLSPPNSYSVVGITLANYGLEDHALVLFATAPISAKERRVIHRCGNTMAALFTQRELTRTLNEVRPFVGLGRLWSGYAHELKGAVGPLLVQGRNLKEWIEKRSAEGMVKISELKDRLKNLWVAIDHLQCTVDYEMGRMIRRQRHRVQVVEEVRKTIQLARANIRHQRKEKDTTIQLGTSLIRLAQIPPEDPVLALEPQVIRQPLLNLLDNALYQVASLGEAGIIHVRVKIDPQDANDLPLHIEVEDNGPGVDSAQKTRLFRPRSSTRGLEGTGMGLYISERLVAAAGGRLELWQTTRFLGSTFRIRLPAKIGEGQD